MTAMRRSHVILGIALLAVTVVAGAFSWRVWQEQQFTATVIAGLAPQPNVTRWPAEFSHRLQAGESSVRTGSDPVAALGRLARLYFSNGFASEASQALTTLRRIEPQEARWPYLLADLKLRIADNTAAEVALREVTELAPAYAPAWIKLGDLLTERGAFTDAERCYTQAAAAAPNEVRAAFALISFEVFHGKRGDPRKELQQLVAIHPGFKPLHELLAEINKAAGDARGAAAQHRLAEASKRYVPLDDPWIDELYGDCFDPNRLTLLAGKMEREGRYDAAVARLNRAIELAPAEPALRNSLAQVHIVANRPEAAVAVLRQAVDDCPDSPALRECLAMLLRTGNRDEEALAVAHAAVARWPKDAAMYTALGQAQREAGQFETALATLQIALELDAAQAEALYATGYCFLATKRRAEAKTALTKALEIRPDYPEALKLRVSIALEEGDVVSAEEPIVRLMALRGSEDDVRLLYAALHLIKGNMARNAGKSAEALRLYGAGLEVLPDFLPLLREAGRLSRRLGREEEARQFFSRGAQAAEAQGDAAQATEFRQLLTQS